MLQRIQTLYLLAAMMLCIGCLCTPVAHFTQMESGVTVDMYNLWLVSSEGQHYASYCPVLMGILVLAAAALFFDIWLFTRRALQMRLATLSMILIVGWYIAYGLLSYYQASAMNVSWRPGWTAALPAAALILAYLAFRAILKDELLVRSLDRLR